MSLLMHYNFNENDNSVVYDYSTNGKDATTINNFNVVAGELGYAGRFNAVDTDIIFGDIGNVGGTKKVSVFCKFNKDTNKNQYLVYKQDHYRLYLNNAGKIIFGIYIGGGWFDIISVATMSNSTWYKVLGVYDGINIYIYIAGLEDNIEEKTGNIDASTRDFIIGSDTADFFDGDIEQVEVWNTAHSADQALAHNNNTIGIKYNTHRVHSLALGDLISVGIYDAGSKRMVVTYVDSTTTFRAVPILNKINFGDTPVRRGNIYNTARQWLAEFRVISGDPILQFFDGVKTFDPSNPNFKILKNGIIFITKIKTANVDTRMDFIAERSSGSFASFRFSNIAGDSSFDVFNNKRVRFFGDVDIVGDLLFIGSGSGLPYGFVEGDHIAWVQANAVQDTWYNISDSDMITRFLNTITHDGNGKMTITKAGIYRVTFNVAYEVSAANVHIEFGIEVDGSGSADAIGPHVHTTSKFSNQEQDGGSTGYMNLEAGATIEVAMRTIDTGTPSFIVDNVHLTCDMIGGI